MIEARWTHPDKVQEAIEGSAAAGQRADGCPVTGLPGQQLHKAARSRQGTQGVQPGRAHQRACCLACCQRGPQHGGQVLGSAPVRRRSGV